MAFFFQSDRLYRMELELVEIKMMLQTIFQEVKNMALGQAELDAAVKAVEDDVAKVVTAVNDAKTQIADLTTQIAALVAAGDTTAIVERLNAVDASLDAAVPDLPTP